MNILVCIKQVPDTTEIRIDPETNTLVRAGVPSIMNPFDAHALELALRLRDREGGAVTAMTMGPAQAVEILKDAVGMGADKAYLLSDRAFGGSDTLATSYILSAAIRKLGGFDLILCGKQAIDGDTGQVGPEIAEHLGLAQVTCAVDAYVDGGALCVERAGHGGTEVVELRLPAVASVARGEHPPRLQTIRNRLRANHGELPVLTAADLGVDPAKIGLKGSPTKVKRTFTPRRNTAGVYIEGAAREQAGALMKALRAAQVL